MNKTFNRLDAEYSTARFFFLFRSFGFKSSTAGIMRSGACNWETKKVEMKAKMGARFPDWLDSFIQAAKGNAKYNGESVFDSDTIFSPSKIAESQGDENESPSNAARSPPARGGKVTAACVTKSLSEMHENPDGVHAHGFPVHRRK